MGGVVPLRTDSGNADCQVRPQLRWCDRNGRDGAAQRRGVSERGATGINFALYLLEEKTQKHRLGRIQINL